jgi:pimeloyl-ACP methyl ester carboxylesterase
VVLLHGYAETSLMWKLVMPLLADRFTVIAPDLPGIEQPTATAEELVKFLKG